MTYLKDLLDSFLLNSGIEGEDQEQEMYSLGKEILHKIKDSRGKLINGERKNYFGMKEKFESYVSSQYNRHYNCFRNLREKIENEEKKFGIYSYPNREKIR